MQPPVAPWTLDVPSFILGICATIGGGWAVGFIFSMLIDLLDFSKKN